LVKIRSEQEMYELIIGTARADERIRAVYMNGSRTDKNAPKDIFQDYDIVYAVRETKHFYEDKHWIDRFGERLYMQCPDELDRSLGKEVDFSQSYGWLIQFADGNRLDLHVESVGCFDYECDKLCRILLDKDGIMPNIHEPTDEQYRVKKPSQAEFEAACNEFSGGA
jgi:aminoglycoside 6-adenylyltransferase